MPLFRAQRENRLVTSPSNFVWSVNVYKYWGKGSEHTDIQLNCKSRKQTNKRSIVGIQETGIYCGTRCPDAGG